MSFTGNRHTSEKYLLRTAGADRNATSEIQLPEAWQSASSRQLAGILDILCNSGLTLKCEKPYGFLCRRGRLFVATDIARSRSLPLIMEDTLPVFGALPRHLITQRCGALHAP
ncbi:hypothetical protein [Pseudomonas sp. FW300-N1A1]|uniref:hypothetical protein n=1 Tax=Pseudomonas sp. FW300-N1A1 TaxID=2075555 RepID=UPI0011AF55FC|nr:hypothetical protein [Pseudomonas sp. FW300-N1A1]